MMERVRGYRLLERAGQDGPWTVYLANATATGADVLVKTLMCHRVDRRALKWIVRDFSFPEALAGHSGVVPVLEVGVTGDKRPFLVTPPHEGLPLAERPDRGLPMPVGQVRGLMRAVARTLAATHAEDGAHGSVKPENVIMTSGGVVLTGFAMSALMSIVELPNGTLPSVHAAPEELEGRSPVAASDVYALGSMMYELLAGKPAFALDGPDSTATFVLGVLAEEPPPLPATVPESLARLVSSALSKNPAARPSAADLAADLAAPPAGGPSTTGPTPTEHALPSLPSAARPPAVSLGRLVAGGPRSAAERRAPDVDVPPPARLDAEDEAAERPEPREDDAGERSEPRELVWTVDPDRSQIRPPAGPQSFLAPAPDIASPSAPEPEPARKSKVPLVVVAASALVVVLGVGSVAVAMSGGAPTASHQPVAAAGDTRATGAPPPATPRPTAADDLGPKASKASQEAQPAASTPARRQSADPATLATYRPKGLKVVSDKGTTVTLSWKSVRDSGYPVIIQQAPGDRMVSATGGANTHTVGGLDPVTGYCFKVGAVVALGRPSSVAWSSALCIRGAAETRPGGQDDEVEPPIVLPPATPAPTALPTPT